MFFTPDAQAPIDLFFKQKHGSQIRASEVAAGLN